MDTAFCNISFYSHFPPPIISCFLGLVLLETSCDCCHSSRNFDGVMYPSEECTHFLVKTSTTLKQ